MDLHHSVQQESLVAPHRGKHSLEICGAISLHELLFGSQEDVGFEPEHREVELTGGSSLLARVTVNPLHAFVGKVPTPLCPLCLLDILADLSLEALTSLLQLFNRAVLRKFIGSASHLALCQSAGEQLLQTGTKLTTL